LLANQIAGPAALGTVQAAAALAGVSMPPEIALPGTDAPAGNAPAGNAPAEDAPPDWTKLLDSAGAAASIVSSPLANRQADQVYAAPQRAGFHPATTRQKMTTSSDAQHSELAAMDPNQPVRDSGANVPVHLAPDQGAPLTVTEMHAAMEAQTAPLSRLESDSPAPRRQPVATAAPATPLPEPLANSVAASPDSMNPGEAPNLAFEAHLIPMLIPVTASGELAVTAAPAARAQTDAPAKAGVPDRLPFVAADSSGKPAVPSAAPPAGTAAGHQQDNSPSDGQKRKDAAPDRLRKADAPQSVDAEAPFAGVKTVPHMTMAPEPPAGRVSGQPASPSNSDPLRPKGTVELPSAPETPPAPAAARDIRLEVNDGDRRVEVRLVERDGEVHVAVRTPDAHLAETLREDLPTLSSRLTESGFRNETWHPGASGSTEWHRQAEPSSGSPQDSNGQPGQNSREQQPGDQQSTRPKVPEEQLNRKEKGKDFEWFMSTLQ
ncbi:MAG TPA: hypothetical protein VNY05_20530, partial [Candidatus Acidoferrales bacterium]|nr:hypothetical protein [Candidatus Acidoferrales bacterium]